MAQVNSKAIYLGVDLGGTKIMAGVLAPNNQLLGRARNKTKAEHGESTVISRVVRTVHEALEDAGLTLEKVAVLGIGAPGPVDVESGVVRTAPNLRWNNFPLGRILQDELKVPVTLENDVNAGAWGEHQVGAGRGFDDMLAVFIGTGIGGGLVLGGTLYRGHFGTAGEIGHTVIRADAPRGWRTVENCASRTSIANNLRELIRTNHPSVLTEITGGDLDKIRSRTLAQAIEKEDPLTLEVVQTGARYVGLAAANIVTILSLPCVVLGGGLVEALGGRFTRWVRDAFEANVFPAELREQCRIKTAQLGDDAGVIGAALLARQRLGKAAVGSSK